MRLSGLIAGLVLAVAPIHVATFAHAADPTERAEVARIRAHFDSVLVELHSRDVSSLTREQRERRDRLAETLAAYRDRGVFPHNYDFPDRPTPYFVDRKTGTLCAVAHLLESTGRRDIVDRVALANNNVWVAELAGDVELGRWLNENGVTLAEAARIQVPYIGPLPQQPQLPAPPPPPQEVRRSAIPVVAPAALGVAAVTTVWNVLSNSDGHRRGVSWSGVAAGALAAAAGTVLMASDNRANGAFAVGATSAAMGGLSILTSSRTIYRRHQIASAEQKRVVAEATLSPIVSGFGGSPAAVGASFTLKF